MRTCVLHVLKYNLLPSKDNLGHRLKMLEHCSILKLGVSTPCRNQYHVENTKHTKM